MDHEQTAFRGVYHVLYVSGGSDDEITLLTSLCTWKPVLFLITWFVCVWHGVYFLYWTATFRSFPLFILLRTCKLTCCLMYMCWVFIFVAKLDMGFTFLMSRVLWIGCGNLCYFGQILGGCYTWFYKLQACVYMLSIRIYVICKIF